MAIARHLGLGFDDVFHVRIAAILHDVGKLGIKDGILNKPGGLTDEEYEIMRRHPGIGAQIMAPISKLKTIIPGIRNHHETWDGNGYPDKLSGEQIPMVARIIGVADTFDAMTTNRPYQKAMTLDLRDREDEGHGRHPIRPQGGRRPSQPPSTRATSCRRNPHPKRSDAESPQEVS